MKLHTTGNQVPSRITAKCFRSVPQMLVLLLCLGLRRPLSAQESDTAPLPKLAPLGTEEVVENLVRMNSERAQALRAYRGTRVYRVEYHGFPGTRSAEMLAVVQYRSPGTKEFTIQSETGSKLIIDKVFKKLLQSEKEALEAENQRRSALNNDNYVFTLLGYEASPAGGMHVLSVEPRIKSKFLYRGTIWVDAEDFAVVRIKAQPAKILSFWTKNTEVEQVYAKVDGFWLPAHNRSVTTIRLGGHADFTIDYTDYRVTGTNPLTEARNRTASGR